MSWSSSTGEVGVELISPGSLGWSGTEAITASWVLTSPLCWNETYAIPGPGFITALHEYLDWVVGHERGG